MPGEGTDGVGGGSAQRGGDLRELCSKEAPKMDWCAHESQSVQAAFNSGLVDSSFTWSDSYILIRTTTEIK